MNNMNVGGRAILKLNHSKSESIMFSSSHNFSHTDNRRIKVGNYQIATVESVCNLGALMDKHLSEQFYLSKIEAHPFPA